jgi:catechol 2,3-dioxygenase-like lactoylglutathione lyase family enzyme
VLSFSHIQLNVSDLAQSVSFYMSVLGPFGFREADAEEGRYARLTNGCDTVVVLSAVEEKYRVHAYHRKRAGLSHVAFAVESRQEVDRMEAVLAALGIPLLGEGKVESDYRRGYYTLAFEDPDRIMIEIVHHSVHYFSASPP